MHLIKFSLYFVLDKNLDVSISGDVDEAKALSKPPDDSQGTNTTTCDLRPARTKTPSLLPVQRSASKVVTGFFCVLLQTTTAIRMQRRSKRKR